MTTRETPTEARERYREALRRAMDVTGVSRSDLARLLGHKEYMVDAWLRHGAGNCIPAYAVDQIERTHPALAAAMRLELDAQRVDGGVSDGDVCVLSKAYGQALCAIGTNARHTTDGAKAALAAIAGVEAAHKQVIPALRGRITNVTTLRRAA